MISICVDFSHGKQRRLQAFFTFVCYICLSSHLSQVGSFNSPGVPSTSSSSIYRVTCKVFCLRCRSFQKLWLCVSPGRNSITSSSSTVVPRGAFRNKLEESRRKVANPLKKFNNIFIELASSLPRSVLFGA